ncbi:MAG: TlpA family protein disulfide reductase [Phycisphaerae bacterium]|nr:TlpA family protein disulfide reductase [Gemmatimonadaceae bacterium]
MTVPMRKGCKVAAITTMLLVAAACSGEKKAEAPRAPVVVGDVAPRFANVSLTGDSLVVGASATGVTLLNVWATWCTSCREEFAELERLRAAHESQGLRVVAVSVDQGTDVKVRKFVEAQRTNFPVAHDADARITSLYGVGGLPTSYLLDASGKVLWRAVGDFRLDSAGLATAIKAALP